MHYEAATVAIKPLVIAVAFGGLSFANRIFAQTDIGQTFEAIGIYGLPTVLVVYFIARDWYREREHNRQVSKDKEELAKLTEADKQRSHEARRDRDREQAQLIAAERTRNHELQMAHHELQMAILEILQHGTTDIKHVTESTTGKFIQQSGKVGNTK